MGLEGSQSHEVSYIGTILQHIPPSVQHQQDTPIQLLEVDLLDYE